MSITITAATIGRDGYLDCTTRPGVPTVNLCGGNAAQLFSLLGLEYNGDFGEATPTDFLGRVLLATALVGAAADDAGRPAITGGRWTQGARGPGYLARRLHDLQEVAEWARGHDATVVWI